MNGYWSASVVALGGALLLGALPRIKRHCRVQDATLMALGLVILANSRPYEGLILALAVAVAILIWLMGPNARNSLSLWATLSYRLCRSWASAQWEPVSTTTVLPETHG